MHLSVRLALPLALLTITNIASAAPQGEQTPAERPEDSPPPPAPRCEIRPADDEYEKVRIRVKTLVDEYLCNKNAFSELGDIYSGVKFKSPEWDKETKSCDIEAETENVGRALEAVECFTEEPLSEDDCSRGNGS